MDSFNDAQAGTKRDGKASRLGSAQLGSGVNYQSLDEFLELKENEMG
jgi:hypothetical protein